jgi:hypothetical protein
MPSKPMDAKANSYCRIDGVQRRHSPPLCADPLLAGPAFYNTIPYSFRNAKRYVGLFVGDALRVADKHRRHVVRSQAQEPQPHDWTEGQIEPERRVRAREKVKITLPSLEHLKRIMRDALSLEDVMKEGTDVEPGAESERRRVRGTRRH